MKSHEFQWFPDELCIVENTLLGIFMGVFGVLGFWCSGMIIVGNSWESVRSHVGLMMPVKSHEFQWVPDEVRVVDGTL